MNSIWSLSNDNNWVLSPPLDVALLRGVEFQFEYEATCAINCAGAYLQGNLFDAADVDFPRTASDVDLDTMLASSAIALGAPLANQATTGVLHTRAANMTLLSACRLAFNDHAGCFTFVTPPVMVANFCPSQRTADALLPKTYSDLSDDVVVNVTCADGFQGDSTAVRD